MDREQLPALTVIHVQSRTVDERLIPQAITFWSGGSDEYRQFGDGFFSRQVRELAKRWTEDVASGWPQVRAIVGRLREHYVLDHAARPPADCQHTAAHFLLSSRRGPDYQFASAAVVLLRSLGMSARVVSGFHVEPSRYDPRAQHTPVFKDDVHFWAEVHSGGGNWIPLEPTPGYELLGPPPTLAERTWRIVLPQTPRTRCPLWPGDGDGVGTRFVVGGGDDIDLERGDIAGGREARVGEEFDWVRGREAGNNGLVLGRVSRAGRHPQLVVVDVG